MSKDYSWAQNKFKLQRALQVYPENEQMCKEFYIRLGGLVLGETTAIEEYPDLTKAPPTSTSTAVAEGKTEGVEPLQATPDAPQGAITQLNTDKVVSPFQCPQCEFIGKNDRSLALHFRKKHTK